MTPLFGLAAPVLLLRGGVRAVGVGRDGLVGRYGLNHLFINPLIVIFTISAVFDIVLVISGLLAK